jgi:thiaminase/transcriptional activator TenA
MGGATQQGGGQASGRLSERLKRASEPTWTAAVQHRFVAELAAGTLPDPVMRRYLIQDYSFLDSFVKLIGTGIAKAPSLADRIPLCRFLYLVTSEENTYFQRAFDALGVPQAERLSPVLREPTRGFHALMADAAAAATYAETLAPLVVFEWLYLSWAEAVAGAVPERFYHAEWISLHANADFARFVGWLRDQFDREEEALPAEALARVEALFGRAVALELAFFDDAYHP